MRTFIAVTIQPEPPLLDMINRMRGRFSSGALKWVAETNLHLTLKFFGDTHSSQRDEIRQEMCTIAAEYSPFIFQLKGLDCFANRGVPRVLFVRVEKGEILEKMAADIEKRMIRPGIQAENRRFNPHLTIARIRFLENPGAFFQTLENTRETCFQEVRVNQLFLYQSILKPSGPEYISLETVTLAGKPDKG